MSLEVLPAPNTILLMHMVPVAVVAYVAAAAGAWTCSPFSVALVRGHKRALHTCSCWSRGVVLRCVGSTKASEEVGQLLHDARQTN